MIWRNNPKNESKVSYIGEYIQTGSLSGWWTFDTSDDYDSLKKALDQFVLNSPDITATRITWVEEKILSVGKRNWEDE